MEIPIGSAPVELPSPAPVADPERRTAESPRRAAESPRRAGESEYRVSTLPSHTQPTGARGASSTLLLQLLALGAAMSLARSVLIPLVFALMLFFLLRPAVRWLTARHVPRPVASGLVLGAALGVLALVTVELAAPAVSWSQRLPDAVGQLEYKTRALRHPIEHLTHGLQAVNRLAEIGHANGVPRVDVVKPGWLDGLVAQATSIATACGITVIAAFFFLIDGDALLGRFMRLAPPLPGNRRATAVMNEVGSRMSAYLGAVTLVNLGLGAVLTCILFALGMPNPLLWGGMAAVLTYVPYVGPAVGLALVTLASFVTFPTAGAAVVPPLAYFGLAMIEGNIVTPMVLGRTFSVRPVIVFVWLTLFAWLWSVPGAILAVPLLMLFKFVADEVPALAPIGYFIRR